MSFWTLAIRSSTEVSTSLVTDGLAGLRDWFDGFWNDALAAYKAAAEQKAREG